jgi:hypothetical protein
MKKQLMWVSSVFALAFAGATLCSAEVQEYVDDGSASAGSDDGSVQAMEGSIMSDSFADSTRSTFRGRWDGKLNLGAFADTNSPTYLAALKINELLADLTPDKKITSAKLIMFCTNNKNNNGEKNEAYAYPMLESWDFNRLCWDIRMVDAKQRKWNTPAEGPNLKPAPDAAAADVKVFDFAEGYKGQPISAVGKRVGSENTKLGTGESIEFDVTAVVKLWQSGELKNYGWALICPTEGSYVRFASSNSEGNKPKLVIEYEQQAATPAP